MRRLLLFGIALLLLAGHTGAADLTLAEKVQMLGQALIGALLGCGVGATTGQTVVAMSNQEPEIQDGFASLLAGAMSGAFTALHFQNTPKLQQRTMRERIEAAQKGMQIGLVLGSVVGGFAGTSSGASDAGGEASPSFSSSSQSSPSSNANTKAEQVLLALPQPVLSSDAKSPLVSHALAGGAAGFAVGLVEPEVMRFAVSFGLRSRSEEDLKRMARENAADTRAKLGKLSSQLSSLRAAAVKDVQEVVETGDISGTVKDRVKQAYKEKKAVLQLKALRRAMLNRKMGPEVMSVVDALKPEDMKELKPMMRGQRVSEDFMREIAKRTGMTIMKLQALFEENNMYTMDYRDVFYARTDAKE